MSFIITSALLFIAVVALKAYNVLLKTTENDAVTRCNFILMLSGKTF